MAFSDPQSVTPHGTAVSLPRTGQGNDSGDFRSADNGLQLKIKQSYGRRTHREIRLVEDKIVSDPLYAGQNLKVSSSVYLVIDHPNQGFSPTELKELAKGLIANLTASTDANLIKFVGGES